ncbi:YbhN family protein [Ammoniphilus sp. 3BR4]|uniref:lysylphosphatidylglycerol synthase transmembrane domain-containing protein n=1 Tax=Ammoniphilus sp. 3BR4 TaxID=3158265 RepID=UPI003464EFA8
MDTERLKKRLWLGLLLGLVVIVGFGLWGDVRELGESFSEFHPGYLALMLLFTFMGYVLRFVKWELYVRSLGIHLSLGQSSMIFLSGMSMAITPGKAGEVLKSFLLKRMKRVEIARSAPIVLAERTTDLLAMAVLASIGISRFSNGSYLLVGTFLFFLILVLLIQSRRLTLQLLGYIKKVSLLKRVGEKLEVFYESSYQLFHWRILIFTTVISLVSWFLECVSLYWVFQGLDIGLPLLEAIYVFSFSSIAGAVSMLPGGLGVAESSMVGLLMGLGTEKTSAVAATLLARFGTLWFGVLLGMITLLAFSRKLFRAEESKS